MPIPMPHSVNDSAPYTPPATAGVITPQQGAGAFSTAAPKPAAWQSPNAFGKIDADAAREEQAAQRRREAAEKARAAAEKAEAARIEREKAEAEAARRAYIKKETDKLLNNQSISPDFI